MNCIDILRFNPRNYRELIVISEQKKCPKCLIHKNSLNGRTGEQSINRSLS